MSAIKTFLAFLIAGCLVALAYIFIGFMLSSSAYADAPNADCTYKPRQSDEVIVHCGTLKGKGSVSVRLCGINYTAEVDCK